VRRSVTRKSGASSARWASPAIIFFGLLTPAFLGPRPLIALPAAAAVPAAPPAADAAQAAFDRGLALFQEATQFQQSSPAAYDEIARRYRGSAESFVEAWKAGAATTEVFTNAANAFHFAVDDGRAILFYRRALSVDPSNRRARDALDHLRSGLPIQKPRAGATSSIARSLFFWHEGLAFSTRKAAFLAVFPAAFAALAASLLRRKPFLGLGLALLVLGLALLGSLVASAFTGSVRNDAVVLVETTGRLGDGTMYSPSHSRPFPPGTEVTIEAVRRSSAPAAEASGGESWAHVRLLDGTDSWVPERCFERVLR